MLFTMVLMVEFVDKSLSVTIEIKLLLNPRINHFTLVGESWDKHVTKYRVCMGTQFRIISLKFKFSNIYELKTHVTRRTTLLIRFEECSCVRKCVINFCFLYVCL